MGARSIVQTVLVEALGQLEPVPERTIVINVNTDLVATRALLSAVEVVKSPLLLVSCEPTPEGRARFAAMSEDRGFDVIELPIRSHGDTLDLLFRELRDERLLLLDSDAEVRSPDHVAWMRSKVDHPDAFGAGFTWGPFFLPESWAATPGTLLYMERPWLPCTMLKVAPVVEALDAGRSFRVRMEPNDLAFSRRLSRILAGRWDPTWAIPTRTWRLLPGPLRRRLAGARLDGLRWARRRYYGLRPNMACYDTAADIYEHLKYERGLVYAGIPVELAGEEVHHYSGVTRHAIHGSFALDTDTSDIESEVVARLEERYGYRWEATQ
jgi:hypothetical protein